MEFCIMHFLHASYKTKFNNIFSIYSINILYSGYAGGSSHLHTGAAVEPLCLPRDPEWGIYRDGTEGAKSYVYGAEYETDTLMSTLYNHDVPCAVCLVRNRSVLQMFPGKTIDT